MEVIQLDIVQAVKNTLSGFVASGADKEYIIQACKEWSGSSTGIFKRPAPDAPPFGAVEDDAIKLTHTYLQYFPDVTLPDDGFMTKAISAANGNLETASAVFDILRQSRERGQWRDETFPAGLVFWYLSNKEHDKLRRQGYAIRKQREESGPESTTKPKPQDMPEPAKAETAAFKPSSNGLDRINAALSGLPKQA